jgi:hypothetical protein
MVKKVILGILTLILVVLVVISVAIAMQSDDLKVTRSATMNAAPAQVFEQVNDFHKWDAWSPWAKLDPKMKTKFSGPAFGTDASYSWIGNDEVGEGKMVISASHPNEHIGIDLEFVKPFAAKNVTDFTFKPDGDKTNVTWAMTGKKNFIMKGFCLVMDMDKMVGADFEKGLAQLKTVVEAAPKLQ